MNQADLDITRYLADWKGQDPATLERLLGVVYHELHRLARIHFAREEGGHTLQPTALVNELYLRLESCQVSGFENRNQFFALVSRLLRAILVDHARKRRAGKRGGSAHRKPLNEAAEPARAPHLDPETMLDLDAALSQLEEVDARQARLVELRYFVGLTLPEAASGLGISRATAQRDWAAARRWLARSLTRSGKD